MIKVLVLCTGNSCRSQMLEGYIRQHSREQVMVCSAGVDPSSVNPYTVKVMNEDGVDISTHRSNNVNEYLDHPLDYVITVCDHAHEKCPVFPSKVKHIHRSFKDPAEAQGTEEEILTQFRMVRDEIKDFSLEFIRLYAESL